MLAADRHDGDCLMRIGGHAAAPVDRNLGRQPLAVFERHQLTIDAEHRRQTRLQVNVRRAATERDGENLVQFHADDGTTRDSKTLDWRGQVGAKTNEPHISGRDGGSCATAETRCLALAELEAATRARLTGLLALDSAGVTAQEAGLQINTYSLLNEVKTPEAVQTAKNILASPPKA